jgi:aminocarboxymuconate-semialdehyde decarboxylase
VGQFWVDSITHNADALRYLISLVGENMIAYGTDYPFPLGDLEHGKFIEDMTDLSYATKQQIFATSLLQFLDLPAAQFQQPGQPDDVEIE